MREDVADATRPASSASPPAPALSAQEGRPPARTSKPERAALAREALAYYAAKLDRRPTEKVWLPKILQRLKTFSAEQLREAIDHLAASEWHREAGFTGPEQVFDSDRRVDTWLNRKPANGGREAYEERDPPMTVVPQPGSPEYERFMRLYRKQGEGR